MTTSARLDRVRHAAAAAVLRRVAGPDPTVVRDRIHRTPGPRWFEPDSPIARVHGDAAMFVGGVRALLLQSLNPRAMAAVAAHSGYRGDPWGRLQRTATFIATTTFGTADDAAQAVAIVRAVHARVSGTTPDGQEYRAADPHLLRWVHVAEVDSFLRAHQAYGRRPLDRAGCEEYVAQAAVVGRALGAEEVPTTVDGLRLALAGYRDELAGTPAAREAARFVLLTPPLPLAVRPAYAAIAAAGVASMPRWSRSMLGLPDLPLLDATVGRWSGHGITRAIRWSLGAAAPGRPDGAPLPSDQDVGRNTGPVPTLVAQTPETPGAVTPTDKASSGR